MFQPLKHKNSNTPLNFEALIRWNHPIKGFISPSDFIPLVEKTLLINNLTLWVLRNTIKYIKKWNEMGVDALVSINVSPRNLYSTTFVDSVQAIINEYNFDNKSLIFELTEGMALNISERSVGNLNRLNNMGIRIAIDDFGSGHTSFNYLIKLPITFVKLDRKLTENIINDHFELVLFNNTIKLLRDLNIEIVAEGVETKEHYEALKKAEISYFQGYYLSKPLDGKDLDKWIIKPPRKFLNL